MELSRDDIALYMGLQNKFWEFDFFEKMFFGQMKELFEQVTKIGLRASQGQLTIFENLIAMTIVGWP